MVRNEANGKYKKEWAPTIINFLLFMAVGIVVVAFVKDLMQMAF